MSVNIYRATQELHGFSLIVTVDAAAAAPQRSMS